MRNGEKEHFLFRRNDLVGHIELTSMKYMVFCWMTFLKTGLVAEVDYWFLLTHKGEIALLRGR